jgi:hypothetical protein
VVGPGQQPHDDAGEGPRRASTPLVVAVLVGVVAVLAGMWWVARPDESGGDTPTRWTQAAQPVAADDLRVLARSVGRTVSSDEVTPSTGADERAGRLGQDLGPAFAVLRSGGAWAGSAWGDGSTTLAAATTAVAEARDDAERPLGSVDAVELCLSHSYEQVGTEGLPGNVEVGVLGLQVVHDDSTAAYSPTLMLANNWDFEDVLERFAEANGTGVGTLLSGEATLHLFGCDQVLVTLADEPRAVAMHRGNTVVPLADVTRAGVGRLADRLGGWLGRHVHADGRMTYEYWPSRGEESSDNNTIRQWMATLALVRYAEHRGGDERVLALAERNIRYNLRALYEEEDGFGLVVEPADGDVKLGAAALAALSIMEHPARRDFAREEAALRRTVDELWQPDGRFRTFYRPSGRDEENQNFYPGEALLLWGETYRRTRDPELLDRFMTSFEHYREWHLDEDNRNPAFVPWHTQAYAQVWRVTRDRELLDFVFEMNDWLLGMQQWEDAEHPDVRGRFYDPERPQYGVPHASSTGVYLEGLAEARRLAELVGDEEREQRYDRAIRRGLRSTMQLQFVDEVDMYYVADRERVRGGVRTTVYDNRIRVDNVQHNLLGIINILRWWPDR